MRSADITSIHKRARVGESLVADCLQRRGFRVLATNFRRKSLELDVVACKGRELLFVEVKTRAQPTDDWRQLIPPRKLQALWRGTEQFVLEHPEFGDYTLHLGLALVQNGIQWMRLPARDTEL